MSQYDLLITKMRARAHRPMGAGVEFLPYELVERAKSTHEGIGSLAADMGSTLLTAEPGSQGAELAADFFKLAAAWIELYKQLRNNETPDMPEQTVKAIDEFDRRYRLAIQAYQQLGYRPSYHPPASYYLELNAKAARTEPNPIPVGKLLAVGGVSIAAFLYFRRNRKKSIEDLEPIRVGPPQLAPEPMPAPPEPRHDLTTRTAAAQTKP